MPASVEGVSTTDKNKEPHRAVLRFQREWPRVTTYNSPELGAAFRNPTTHTPAFIDVGYSRKCEVVRLRNPGALG